MMSIKHASTGMFAQQIYVIGLPGGIICHQSLRICTNVADEWPTSSKQSSISRSRTLDPGSGSRILGPGSSMQDLGPGVLKNE